jgi:hypothetical protein
MSIVSDIDFGELHFDGVWTGLCSDFWKSL